jgi:preprotein translocase subunit SecE
MGKVKDESTAVKTTKSSAPRAGGGGGPRFLAQVAPFFTNFFRPDTYKPQQGWHARLWTGVGLGLLVLTGLYRLYVTQLEGETTLPVQYGVPIGLGLVLGWIVYRIIHFPPFADFLIATEAEMNKVSWTTKAELKRATMVVLTTVALLAIYLFVVDRVWVYLLQLIRVLHLGDTTDFGSQAG